MKTAVLFDMDGVLIDTETVYARCLSMAFQEKGYSIPASDFYCFAGMEFQTKFETIIRARGRKNWRSPTARPSESCCWTLGRC